MVDRRLAAILAADVVGYSRLMGKDEERTLKALRSLRDELFGPAVAGHKGKVVKNLGDGWIVEFTSVVEAVNCALQIQTGLVGHEAIKLRIGIHIGDIVHDHDDIFGDGVNVAARLETFAEPGTVAISDAVFGSLDGTLRPSFDNAGAQSLKNISRPIQVWTCSPGRPGSPDSSGSVRSSSGSSADGGRPSIAIQPIATSDNRHEIRELADALTNDVQSYLQAVNWLTVLTTANPTNETYVLKAALRSSGSKLRLDAHVTAKHGGNVWSGKFDGDIESVFDWQDRVGEDMIAQVLGHLLDAERDKLADVSLEEMTAAQCELAAQLHFALVDNEAFETTLRFASSAIKKDPQFADAYATAIVSYLSGVASGSTKATEPYRHCLDNWIEAATPLALAHPRLDLVVGIAMYFRERDGASLIDTVNRTLRRGASDIATLANCGWSNVWLGRPQDAIDCFDRALRLGRFSPWMLPALGGAALANVQAGRYEAAISLSHKGIERSQSFGANYRALAAACALSGRQDEAREAMGTLLQLYPDDTVTKNSVRAGYPKNEFTERYFEGLRLAGMPE